MLKQVPIVDIATSTIAFESKWPDILKVYYCN